MKNSTIPMIGLTFGRLVVVSRGTKTDKSGQAYWVCSCECGREVEVGGANLRRGNSKSCGCLQRDTVVITGTTHGGSKSPENMSWRCMKQRCYNPKAAKYELYGGRGIIVCDRWKDDFSAFLEDMGPRPSPDHSIDRIDGNGNYEPGNCRWASDIEQNRNTSRNHFLEYRGETKTIAEWAEIFGLPNTALNHRITQLNWDVEKALTTPIQKRSPRAQTGAV